MVPRINPHFFLWPASRLFPRLWEKLAFYFPELPSVAEHHQRDEVLRDAAKYAINKGSHGLAGGHRGWNG